MNQGQWRAWNLEKFSPKQACRRMSRQLVTAIATALLFQPHVATAQQLRGVAASLAEDVHPLSTRSFLKPQCSFDGEVCDDGRGVCMRHLFLGFRCNPQQSSQRQIASVNALSRRRQLLVTRMPPPSATARCHDDPYMDDWLMKNPLTGRATCSSLVKNHETETGQAICDLEFQEFHRMQIKEFDECPKLPARLLRKIRSLASLSETPPEIPLKIRHLCRKSCGVCAVGQLAAATAEKSDFES